MNVFRFCIVHLTFPISVGHEPPSFILCNYIICRLVLQSTRSSIVSVTILFVSGSRTISASTVIQREFFYYFEQRHISFLFDFFDALSVFCPVLFFPLQGFVFEKSQKVAERFWSKVPLGLYIGVVAFERALYRSNCRLDVRLSLVFSYYPNLVFRSRGPQHLFIHIVPYM